MKLVFATPGRSPGLVLAERFGAKGALRNSATLLATTKKFADALARHARLLTRVKNASEGMVRAIAEEVDRRRAPSRFYTRPTDTKPKQSSAMIFNSVV